MRKYYYSVLKKDPNSYAIALVKSRTRVCSKISARHYASIFNNKPL